jgi:endonuclease-3
MTKTLSTREIATFYRRLAKENPEPRGELAYDNHYTLLVAIVLSAQATDKGVNRATKPLFQKIKTPEAMVKLGEARLTEYIKSIGLFRTKAKNVIALSKILLAEHKGKVPRTREALEALPGVGRKTANVLLNIAFGEPTIAVDTHIFRVSNRTGLASGKNVLEVEQSLLERTPKKFLTHAHHWLILHGRYICTAKKLHCDKCPVRDICLFEGKIL